MGLNTTHQIRQHYIFFTQVEIATKGAIENKVLQRLHKLSMYFFCYIRVILCCPKAWSAAGAFGGERQMHYCNCFLACSEKERGHKEGG